MRIIASFAALWLAWWAFRAAALDAADNPRRHADAIFIAQACLTMAAFGLTLGAIWS